MEESPFAKMVQPGGRAATVIIVLDVGCARAIPPLFTRNCRSVICARKAIPTSKAQAHRPSCRGSLRQTWPVVGGKLAEAARPVARSISSSLKEPGGFRARHVTAQLKEMAAASWR